MSEVTCPDCGAAVALDGVFALGACPNCETPLTELHAIAAAGGAQ